MPKSRNHNLILGCAITFFMAALIILGFFWTPYEPGAMSSAERMDGPSLAHIMGTDNFGRDIFSRVLEGAGSTMLIAAATVCAGLIVGILVGAFTGYFGGWLDEVLMRIADVITAFPSILMAMVLVSLLGTGKYNIILALSILFVPSFARVVRSEFAKQKQLDYVRSARLMGAGHLRIMFVHILPNVMPVVLSTVAIGFNNAVLAEASMSFLGIGVSVTEPSLGRMLSESQSYLFTAPWYPLCTGCTIVLLILGFGLISDGLGGRKDA
ncbi:MAG: ABC transporter permease [Oscillospiraceae bacterium]|nr:ABC transporter permease [Oscillospiraceae bacterium]